MEGKAKLLAALDAGTVKVIAVEVINRPASAMDFQRRLNIIVPDDGRIATAYPDLRPTEAVVRWRHPAEPKRNVQSGHVWLETNGAPVVVHGACYGVFALADVIVLNDEDEPLE